MGGVNLQKLRRFKRNKEYQNSNYMQWMVMTAFTSLMLHREYIYKTRLPDVPLTHVFKQKLFWYKFSWNLRWHIHNLFEIPSVICFDRKSSLYLSWFFKSAKHTKTRFYNCEELFGLKPKKLCFKRNMLFSFWLEEKKSN